jgi:amino acid transporter
MVVFVNILVFALFFSFLGLPYLYLDAQTGGQGCDPKISFCNPIQSGDFADVMKKVATIAASIGLLIVVFFIIYAGFLFVSARGNEEQLEKAKRTFFWAVIGAILVVGAFAIAEAIDQFAKQL